MSAISESRLGDCLYLADDLLQIQVRIYLQHGGNLFTDDLFRLQNLLLSRGQGAANWIPGCLFQSSGSCTIDDLSSLEICFLGTLAHVDSAFRYRLKAYLTSYRSPLLAAGTIYADSLLESTFGMASVLSHFYRLDREESGEFLVTLCRTGTPSMLRPFIDIGIDLNGAISHFNMLGNAAAVGNLDIVSVLVERGANGAQALFSFLNGSKDLPDGLFKHLLELLLENSRPTSFAYFHYDDALLSIIRSSRALSSHPKAPEILFRRKVFSDELIRRSCQHIYECNYMCVAISYHSDSVVRLLLQHAAYADTKSTWLKLSVERGGASCTEALIQYGADVSFVDGAGRSALQLARSNMNAPHPRMNTDCGRHFPYVYKDRREVTAEEDAETLAVVEQAFRLKARSTDCLKKYEPECGFEVQSHDLEDKTTPVPQNMFKKALRFLSTCYAPPFHGHRMESHYRGIGGLWSLSFYEALRMRFFYVLSYVLLLAVGIVAVIRGDKRVRMPSRSILSAVALLLLAYIWGSSLQTNLSTNLGNG